jgi:molybdate transport repressor ModE-like protein
MRRLHATIGWRLSGRTGEVLDPRVVDLVALAAQHGSLAAAARAAGLPYRTAWALVAGAERALGQRLLLLERGVGAKPAALGRRILAARAEAQRVIAAQRDVLDVPLGHEHAPQDRAGLRIAASHDLVLAQCARLARRYGIGRLPGARRPRSHRWGAPTAGFHAGIGDGKAGVGPGRQTPGPTPDRCWLTAARATPCCRSSCARS